MGLKGSGFELHSELSLYELARLTVGDRGSGIGWDTLRKRSAIAPKIDIPENRYP